MIITLKNGDKKEYAKPMTLVEIAADLSGKLARSAVAAEVNGEIKDLRTKIEVDSAVCFYTADQEQGLSVMRHTASHVLAQAVKRLYPKTKLAIGPSIANGFYYDFEFDTQVSAEQFAAIENEMQKIVKENLVIERFTMTKEEALRYFEEKEEPYKKELVQELKDGVEISFYKQGEFCDLCAGPHLKSTGEVKAFRLMNIAGAYWKGDEKNKMLTRIYASAFNKKSELDDYVASVEEAKRRDHNKLGRELGIFMTDENVGQGLPLFMPKGAKILQILERFVEDEEERRGYLLTRTPFMAKNNLYKISGHWDHYQDKMFVIGDESKDEDVYALRPMTCPFQYTIYNNGIKSYKDLPVRYAETSTLFRKEASGEMHGLIRIRQFTLADGHVICRPDQLEEEFRAALDLIYYLLDCFGFRDMVSLRFSRWDENDKEKYIGTAEEWDRTENVMRNILTHMKLDFIEEKGEAAFYGPKLDVQAKNVHGKEDTLFTIQIDFSLAERFNMTYVDEDGTKKTPYIIHRSSIGCYERTLAMLIEKYAGALPLWISPVQVEVLSITERTKEFAQKICDGLRKVGVRCETDTRNEKIGYKIRSAQLEKIPYMLVVGDKEAEKEEVSVRHRSKGDLGVMSIAEFTQKVKKEIEDKNLD